MPLRLHALLVLWLSAALAVLTQPSSVPKDDGHDGFERPAGVDVSANASRRADLSAAAEKRAVDDDNDRVFAAPDGRAASIPTNEWAEQSARDARHSLTAARAAHASPRGPPQAG